MAKVDWKKKHLKAFKMYLQGNSSSQIATELDVDRKTIWSWERRGNWKEYVDKKTQELMSKIGIDVNEEKERSLKLIKAGEAYWARKLQEGDLKANFGDLSQLQRAKWEILAPKNISQFNFMKAETTNTIINASEATQALEDLKNYANRLRARSDQSVPVSD